MKPTFRPVLRALALALFCGAAGILPVSAQVPDTLVQTLLPTPKIPQSGAELGYSVAIDGEFTVVGAPYDDIDGLRVGVVKVFNSTTGALHLVLHSPQSESGQSFGYSVAISGTRIAVGALFGFVGNDNAGVVYVYDLAGVTPSVPITKLENPQFTDDGSFGYAIAISGTRLVVGASENAVGVEQEAGNVYIYNLDSETPTIPVFTLDNPAPAGNDKFGEAVAIDGMRVVVGTPNDQTDDETEGSVYVYDLAGATPTVPVLTLQNPAGLVNDAFGVSVALSGTRLVIGSSSANLVKRAAGGAYVYDLGNATPAMPVAILPNPRPVTFDNFGWSVALSGSLVVVSDPKDATRAADAGSVYVFDLDGATPTVPVTTLNQPNAAAGDNFGWAIALSGMHLIVGTPNDDTGASNTGSVFVYDLVGGATAVQTLKLNDPGPATLDHFGYAVAVSGSLMVVGTPYSDIGVKHSGSVYVYDLAGPMPMMPVQVLSNPNPGDGDSFRYTEFGCAVGIDGTRIVVGAGYSQEGRAYVYDLSSATPAVPVAHLDEPKQANLTQFGASVAISGTHVVVGAPFTKIGSSEQGSFAGTAYVYDLASATPSVPAVTLFAPVLNSVARFGSSVAISGSRVVVGAPYESLGTSQEGVSVGGAYVYDLTAVTPSVAIGALHKPNPQGYQYFGYSVAISGPLVVIGIPGDNTGTGSTYVYDFSHGASRIASSTLHNPTLAGYQYFGYSVAISGTRIVVGTPGDSTAASATGSAYIYDLGSAKPTTPSATLLNPHPAVNDNFGYAVAIDGTTVVIGTPFDDTVKLDRGAAYVYGPDPNATPGDGNTAPSDGLLTAWKLAHFGTTAGHGPLVDDDHDGLNNLLEEAFGTDPLKPDIAAAVPAPVNEGGYLTITITKHPGVIYEVQSSATPDPTTFTATTTTVLLDNATTLKVRDNFPIGTTPGRFLRVKVTAAP